MRQKRLIIGKWKMRRIRGLEISCLTAGRASGRSGLSAMSSDGVDGRNGVYGD